MGRAHDGICLFDQALIWVIALHRAGRAGAGVDGLRIGADQLRAVEFLSERLIETVAALRLLILSGLSAPALQLARSVSEDVDMLLALLLRPRLAQQFVACRTADEANDFWRRHISGGRAFRLVAEKLYSIGLDHSDESEYGRWRREVLTLLGSAVHSSPLGRGGRDAGRSWPQDQVALDCLEFVTHRLHELCAWAHLLDPSLAADLDRISAARTVSGPAVLSGADLRLLTYAAHSRDILLDQMRWVVAGQAAPAIPAISAARVIH
ncbi:hypothetical protein CDV52_19450 [Haematobacter missouriensis]|uniref:Uncharacterized protein n=1 Tax=Haematobacter missouriensis TaxID=366616 RepID=A0A212AHY1_9RHOB|nr:hypothetical protein CDV53_20615 [Haematobacter missouriensis]OWJ81112.1 hypothetical protein CDV52_19450 [Haematobacter missouriensis]